MQLSAPSTSTTSIMVRKSVPIVQSNQSKQAVNTLANNKSLTVFQTNKATTNQIPKSSNVNSSITLSPIRTASDLNKTANLPIIKSVSGGYKPPQKTFSISTAINKDDKIKTTISNTPKVFIQRPAQWQPKNNSNVKTVNVLSNKPMSTVSISSPNTLSDRRTINLPTSVNKRTLPSQQNVKVTTTPPALARLSPSTTTVQTVHANKQTGKIKVQPISVKTSPAVFSMSSIKPQQTIFVGSGSSSANRKRSAVPSLTNLSPSNVNGLTVTPVKRSKLTENKASTSQQNQHGGMVCMISYYLF